MLLKDLYYMTQIAGCGSLSRAARQLGITQSALSHAVSRLEREFSVPLLARQTGGVTLTPAGQAMVAEAQTILFHCRTMKETLAGYAQADRRNLKIGITTLHEKYVIPMLVKHYSASYPQTSITFVSAHSDELEEKVLAGALDFCIMPLPVRSPRLAARKLFSEEILLALPASHPFVNQFPPGALTFRELALLENETFIITRKNGKFAGVCLDICGSLFPPVNLIEINSLDTLYALIAKNTGVGFIPATLVRSEDLGKKIVCYRLKDLQAQQTFVIARDPARELTAAAAEFIGVACGLFAGQTQTYGNLAAEAVPLPSPRQPPDAQNAAEPGV